jgi:hypothetical protein
LICILQVFQIFGYFPVGLSKHGFELVQALQAAVEEAACLDPVCVGEGRETGEVRGLGFVPGEVFGELLAKTAFGLKATEFGGAAAEGVGGAGAGPVVLFDVGFVLFRGIGVEKLVELTEAPGGLDDFRGEDFFQNGFGPEFLEEAGAETLVFDLRWCGHGISLAGQVVGFVLFRTCWFRVRVLRRGSSRWRRGHQAGQRAGGDAGFRTGLNRRERCSG